MKSFMLLSVLASTAAAKSAQEVIEDLWVAFGNGESIVPAFTDDAVCDLSVMSTEESGYNYAWNGHNQVGVNGFTIQKYMESVLSFQFYKFERSNMVPVDDDSKYAYVLTQYARTNTGVRYSTKQLQEWSINAEGKIDYFASHDLQGTYKGTDAKSTGIRMLEAWKAGDLKTFFANCHEDIVVDTNIGVPEGVTSMAGTYRGHAGFTKLMENQVEVLDLDYSKRTDGTFIIDYKFLQSNDDGKGAFFEYEIPVKYKTGAAYHVTMKAYFKVDDLGLLVDYRFYETGAIKFSDNVDKKEL